MNSISSTKRMQIHALLRMLCVKYWPPSLTNIANLPMIHLCGFTSATRRPSTNTMSRQKVGVHWRNYVWKSCKTRVQNTIRPGKNGSMHLLAKTDKLDISWSRRESCLIIREFYSIPDKLSQYRVLNGLLVN